MRVKLRKGKQTELMNLIKVKEGVNWLELSKIIDISYSSLKSWKREELLIPLDVMKKFGVFKQFRKYIIEFKEDNWGSIKGGFNSTGTTKEIKIPSKNRLLAEFMGILLGDGNSFSLRKDKKIGVYVVRIAGDSRKDKDYLERFIPELANQLFGIKSSFRYDKKSNAMWVSFYSKKLVEFLSKVGFPSGDKIKNKLGIPNWIKQDKRLVCYCIRGLIDTDGSVYRMSKKDFNLVRIDFTNYNHRLLNDYKKGLEILGYNPSKIINNRKIIISRQKEIVRFFNEIGFSNSKHIKRIKEINPLLKSPVV